jgi:glycine cleavage system aminomethyltransferase T
MIDLAWFREHAPRDGSVQITDVSSKFTSVGLWGPKARLVLQNICEEDLSNSAFPYFSAQNITIESIPALALRLSYVGELGWEIYVPSEYGLRLWDQIWQAGQSHQIIAAGMGAFDSLRLEKGYRAIGSDIHAGYNLFEAGLDWAVRFDKGEFIGRDALLQVRDEGINQKLCCLTLQDGVALGKEPILDGDQVIGYVTSANYGYSIGRQIAYGYLPMTHTSKGTQVEIEYLGRRYPALVTDDPLFDPKMRRLKA